MNFDQGFGSLEVPNLKSARSSPPFDTQKSKAVSDFGPGLVFLYSSNAFLQRSVCKLRSILNIRMGLGQKRLLNLEKKFFLIQSLPYNYLNFLHNSCHNQQHWDLTFQYLEPGLLQLYTIVIENCFQQVKANRTDGKFAH